MQHSYGGRVVLFLTGYKVRQNDDGRGWTGRGEHHMLGPIVLGVRARQRDSRRRRVFGRKVQGWAFQMFIQIPGQPEKAFRETFAAPSLDNVYGTFAQSVEYALDRRRGLS